MIWLLFLDPFGDATSNLKDDHNKEDVNLGQGLIHIRIQQRNGRKTLTTVQGIIDQFDKKKLVRAFKKENNSLKAKNLKTSTAYYQLENGDECDSNYNCKSHYCGYNGPVLYDSPEDYTLYACMKKHSKAYNEPCWHDGECKQHKGLLFYWSKCTGIWDIKYRREEYRCK